MAHPDHQLIRIVRCSDGEVAVKVKYVPRFDYGLTTPEARDARRRPRGHLRRRRRARPAERAAVRARGALGDRGQPHARRGRGGVRRPYLRAPARARAAPADARRGARQFDGTVARWAAWAERCMYEARIRRGRAQRARAQGADERADRRDRRCGDHLAARRDRRRAELGLPLLLAARLGADAERALRARLRGRGERVHGWLAANDRGPGGELQIMYGVGGERLLPEVELDWLEGYRGSRPVRIGNGAYSQFQLDVFGELMDTVWVYRQHGGEIDDVFWEFLGRVAGAVIEPLAPARPGHLGVRGEPLHFVYSKVMVWVGASTASCGSPSSTARGHPRRVGGANRDELRELIEREGVDAESGAFLQSFGDGRQARRVEPDDPARGLRRHSDPRAVRDLRADRGGALCGRFRLPLRHGRRGRLSGDEATFGDLLVLAGQNCPARGATASVRVSCSSGCSASATTSGCSRKRSTRAQAS